MNSLRKLLLAKSILAAAVASSGIAAPAISHALAVGGPSSGVVCPSGYTGAFDGTRLKCSKVKVVNVPLRCLDSRYPNYLIRAVVAPTGVGRDFCLKNGVQLGTNDPITGLVLGTATVLGDYVHANFDPAEVATKIVAEDAAETAAQGNPAGGVDTTAGTSTIDLGGAGGNKDRANTTLTFFTFAKPASPVINTGPISPVAAPFAPRPLP
jgi:hypothetical protein